MKSLTQKLRDGDVEYTSIEQVYQLYFDALEEWDKSSNPNPSNAKIADYLGFTKEEASEIIRDKNQLINIVTGGKFRV